MLSTANYSGLIIGSGAALLSAPFSAGNGLEALSSSKSINVVVSSWSDRSYRFKFSAPKQRNIAISEMESKALHASLLASCDEIIAPVLML